MAEVLSFGGGTTATGATGGVPVSEDVAVGVTRGGATELVFFFASSTSTGAVTAVTGTGVPGTTGMPGVTVEGRGGASIRLVGGGGGGTTEVFFSCFTGSSGGAGSTLEGMPGGRGRMAVFFSSAMGGVGGAAAWAGTGSVLRELDGIGSCGAAGIDAVLIGPGAGMGAVMVGMPPVVFFLTGCSGGATAPPTEGRLPVVFRVAFSGTGGASGEGAGAIGAGETAAGGITGVGGMGGGRIGAEAGLTAGDSFATTIGTGGFTTGVRIGADWATAIGTGGATAGVTSSGWVTTCEPGFTGRSTRRRELVGRLTWTGAVPPPGSWGRPGETVMPDLASGGVERGGWGASGWGGWSTWGGRAGGAFASAGREGGGVGMETAGEPGARLTVGALLETMLTRLVAARFGGVAWWGIGSNFSGVALLSGSRKTLAWGLATTTRDAIWPEEVIVLAPGTAPVTGGAAEGAGAPAPGAEPATPGFGITVVGGRSVSTALACGRGGKSGEVFEPGGAPDTGGALGGS